MVKPRNSRGKSTTWLPFLRNHLDVSWAIDFFSVNTIWFATLYILIVLDHSRRQVVDLAITRNPAIRTDTVPDVVHDLQSSTTT